MEAQAEQEYRRALIRRIKGVPHLCYSAGEVSLGAPDELYLITCHPSEGFNMKSIFNGEYERNVSPDQIDEYISKLMLLPAATISVEIPHSIHIKKRGVYVRVNARGGLFHYACDQYAVISRGTSREVVNAGETITLNGVTFPYGLARLIQVELKLLDR